MRRNKHDPDPPLGRASRRLAQFEDARHPPDEVTQPAETVPKPEHGPDRERDAAEEQEGH